MSEIRDDEYARFAKVFAPGEHRAVLPRDRTWLATGVIFVVAGAVLTYVAWLSFTRNLPLNGFVGLRSKDTMASVAAWQRSQRAAAPLTLGQGLSLLTGGSWMLARRPPPRKVRIGAGISAGVFGLLVLAAMMVATKAVSS